MAYHAGETGEFCWNRLMTSNVSEAAKFYAEIFGWNSKEISINGMPVSVFTYNNVNVAGLMKIPQRLETSFKPHWLGFIAVDNIHIAVHKAKKMGATVMLPVTSLGAANGLAAIIIDPLGAQIGLWQKGDVTSY